MRQDKKLLKDAKALAKLGMPLAASFAAAGNAAGLAELLQVYDSLAFATATLRFHRGESTARERQETARLRALARALTHVWAAADAARERRLVQACPRAMGDGDWPPINLDSH